jgi:hypothetical protein
LTDWTCARLGRVAASESYGNLRDIICTYIGRCNKNFLKMCSRLKIFFVGAPAVLLPLPGRMSVKLDLQGRP